MKSKMNVPLLLCALLLIALIPVLLVGAGMIYRPAESAIDQNAGIFANMFSFTLGGAWMRAFYLAYLGAVGVQSLFIALWVLAQTRYPPAELPDLRARLWALWALLPSILACAASMLIFALCCRLAPGVGSATWARVYAPWLWPLIAPFLVLIPANLPAIRNRA